MACRCQRLTIHSIDSATRQSTDHLRCCKLGARKCGSVQYYPRQKRCEVIAKSWCEINSSEDIIARRVRGVIYIGQLCDLEED